MQNKYPQFDNRFAEDKLLLGMFVYLADKPTVTPEVKAETKKLDEKKEPTQVELEHEVGALQKLLDETDKVRKANNVPNKDILIGKYKEFGNTKNTLEKTIEDDAKFSKEEQAALLGAKNENREALLADVRKAWVEVSTLKTTLEETDQAKKTKAVAERVKGRTDKQKEGGTEEKDWAQIQSYLNTWGKELEETLGKETVQAYRDASKEQSLQKITKDKPASVRGLREQLREMSKEMSYRQQWETWGENIDKEDPNTFLEGLNTDGLVLGQIDEKNFDTQLPLYFDQFQKYTTAATKIQEAMTKAQAVKEGCKKARSKLGVMESGKTHRGVLGKLLTFSAKCNTAISGLNRNTEKLKESGKALLAFQRKRMGTHQEILKQLIVSKQGALAAFDSHADSQTKKSGYQELLTEIRETAAEAIGKEKIQQGKEREALEEEKEVQRQELDKQRTKRKAELEKGEAERKSTKTQLETRRDELKKQIKESSGDAKTKQERQLNAVNDLLEKISATGTQITEKDIDTIFANQEAVIIQYFDEKIDNTNLAIQELMGRQEQITKELDKTEAQVQEMLAITTNQQRDAFEAAYDAQIDQYRMAYVNDAMQMENLESMVKGYDFGQAIKGLTETAEKVSNVNENEGKPNWLQQFGNSAAQSVEIMLPKDAGGLQKALLVIPATMIEYLGEMSKGIGDLASDKEMRKALWEQITTNPGGFGWTLLKGLIRYDQYAESKDIFDVIRTSLKSVIDILLTATGVGAIKHGLSSGRAVATGAIRGGAAIGKNLAKAMRLGAGGTRALKITGGTLAGFVGVPAGIVAVPIITAGNFALNLPANTVRAVGGLAKLPFSMLGFSKAFGKAWKVRGIADDIGNISKTSAETLAQIEKTGSRTARFFKPWKEMTHGAKDFWKTATTKGALKPMVPFAKGSGTFYGTILKHIAYDIPAGILRMGLSPLGLTQAFDIMRLSTGAGFFNRVWLGAKEFGTTNLVIDTLFTKTRNFRGSMGTLRRTWSPRAALAHARKMRAEKTIAKLEAIREAQKGIVHNPAVGMAYDAIGLRIAELQAVVKNADTVIDTATNFVKIQKATTARIQGLVGSKKALQSEQIDGLAKAMEDAKAGKSSEMIVKVDDNWSIRLTKDGQPVQLSQKEFEALASELRAYAENSAKIKALNAPSQAAKTAADDMAKSGEKIKRVEDELTAAKKQVTDHGNKKKSLTQQIAQEKKAQQETLTQMGEGIKKKIETSAKSLDEQLGKKIEIIKKQDSAVAQGFESQLQEIQKTEKAALDNLKTAVKQSNADDIQKYAKELDDVITARKTLYKDIVKHQRKTSSEALITSAKKVREAGGKIKDRIRTANSEIQTNLETALTELKKTNPDDAKSFEQTITETAKKQQTLEKGLDTAIQRGDVQGIKKSMQELDTVMETRRTIHTDILKKSEGLKRASETQSLQSTIKTTASDIKKHIEATRKSLDEQFAATLDAVKNKDEALKPFQTEIDKINKLETETLAQFDSATNTTKVREATEMLDEIIKERTKLYGKILEKHKEAVSNALTKAKGSPQKTAETIKRAFIEKSAEVKGRLRKMHDAIKDTDFDGAHKFIQTYKSQINAEQRLLKKLENAAKAGDISEMKKVSGNLNELMADRIKFHNEMTPQISVTTMDNMGIAKPIVAPKAPEDFSRLIDSVINETAVKPLEQQLQRLRGSGSAQYTDAMETFGKKIAEQANKEAVLTSPAAPITSKPGKIADTVKSELATLEAEQTRIQSLRQELASMDTNLATTPEEISRTARKGLHEYAAKKRAIENLKQTGKETKNTITQEQILVRKLETQLQEAREALATQKATLTEALTPASIKGTEFGDKFLRVREELLTKNTASFEKGVLKGEITVEDFTIKASNKGADIGLSRPPTLEDIATFQVEFAQYKAALKEAAPGIEFSPDEIAKIIVQRRQVGEFATPAVSLREATRRSAVRTVESAKKGLISARDLVVEQARNFLTQKNPVAIGIHMALDFVKRTARGTMEAISPQWLVEFFSHNAALRSIRQGPLDDVAREAGVTGEAAQLALNNAKNQFESMFEALSRTMTPAKSPGRNIGRGSITAELMGRWKSGKTLTLAEATSLYAAYVAINSGDKMKPLVAKGRELMEEDKKIDAQIDKLKEMREKNKEAFDLYTEVMQSEDRNLGGRGRFETTTTKVEQRSFWEKIIAFFQTLASGKIMEAFKEFSKGKEVTKNFSEAQLKGMYGTSMNIINNTNEMIQDTKENCDLMRVVPSAEGADVSDPLIMFLELNETTPQKSRVFSINRKGYTVDCKEKEGAKNNRTLTIEGADYELTRTENGKILAKKDGVERPLVEYLNMAEAKKRGGLYIDTYNSGQSVLWSQDGNTQVLGEPFKGKELKDVKTAGTAPNDYFTVTAGRKAYQIQRINGMFHYRTEATGDFIQIPLPGKKVEEPKAPEVAVKPETPPAKPATETPAKPAETPPTETKPT